MSVAAEKSAGVAVAGMGGGASAVGGERGEVQQESRYREMEEFAATHHVLQAQAP